MSSGNLRNYFWKCKSDNEIGWRLQRKISFRCKCAVFPSKGMHTAFSVPFKATLCSSPTQHRRRVSKAPCRPSGLGPTRTWPRLFFIPDRVARYWVNYEN